MMPGPGGWELWWVANGKLKPGNADGATRSCRTSPLKMERAGPRQAILICPSSEGDARNSNGGEEWIIE